MPTMLRASRRALAGAALLVSMAVALTAFGPGRATAAVPPRVEALFIQRHPHGLARFVRRVSDPDSPRYRHYLSVGKLIRRFGASHSTERRAKDWLAERGLRGRVGRTRTYLLTTLPGPRAAQLLAPRSSARARVGRLGRRHPAVPGRVPRGLQPAVRAISLLSKDPGAVSVGGALGGRSGAASIPPLPPAHGSERDRTGTPAGCGAGRSAGFTAPDSAFTPNQYLTAYGHAKLHERGLRGRGERVSFIEIDGFKRSDVKAFGACFGISIPPIHVHPVGGSVLAPGGETTLDLEVFSAAAPKADGLDVYEGSSSASGILETSAAALGRKGRHPDVISVSLEGCEPRYVGQRAFAEAYGNVFAIAAGAGISTLVAAGDQGSSMCTEGQTALGLLATSLPATSPYVTSVGGTNLVLHPGNSIANQLVWNDSPQTFGATGGGYSLLFAKPWWQKVSSTDDARSVPDIAALADIVPGFAIYCTAAPCSTAPQQTTPGWIGIGGTSAATPLMAGGIALADQSARAHGQGSLGFLNPLLYGIGRSRSHRSVFYDLRHGDNDLGEMIPPSAGGGQPLGCCSAKRKYDLVSGWGSPNLVALDRAARRAAGRR
jgi:subtilase family serine protease